MGTYNWYCMTDGSELGPLSAQELQNLARAGRLQRTDLIRRGETGSWVPAERVKGLSFPLASPTTPIQAPTTPDALSYRSGNRQRSIATPPVKLAPSGQTSDTVPGHQAAAELPPQTVNPSTDVPSSLESKGLSRNLLPAFNIKAGGTVAGVTAAAMMLWMYFAGASRVPVPNIQLPAPSQPPRPVATSPAQDHRAPEHANSPSTNVAKPVAEERQEAPGNSSASVATGQASHPSTLEKTESKREETGGSRSNGPRFRARAMLKGHAAAVNSVVFCSNKNELLSASTDSTLRFWHELDGKGEAILAKYDHVGFSVAVSPDGTTVASGIGDRTVGLWDRKTLREQLLDGHANIVTSVAFSPNGELLASGSVGGTVKLWSTSDARLQRTLTLPYLTAMSLAFSADSRLLAGSAGNNTVTIWDVASGKERAVLSGQSAPIMEVAFSPEGQTIASASADRTIKLWDVASAKPRASLIGHTKGVCAVAFSPNSKLIASGGGDRTVRVWSMDTKREIVTLEGHSDIVHCVAFSLDGHLLASGSEDSTIRIWELVGGDSALSTTQAVVPLPPDRATPPKRELSSSESALSRFIKQDSFCRDIVEGLPLARFKETTENAKEVWDQFPPNMGIRMFRESVFDYLFLDERLVHITYRLPRSNEAVERQLTEYTAGLGQPTSTEAPEGSPASGAAIYRMWDIPEFDLKVSLCVHPSRDTVWMVGLFSSASGVAEVLRRYEQGRSSDHELNQECLKSPPSQHEPDIIENSLGMKFIRIPEGEYIMGSPKTEKFRDGGEQQHRVVINRAFYLGIYEVTQGEFVRVMRKNPSYFSKKNKGSEKVRRINTNRLPVESVSWDDAIEFCHKLSSIPKERDAGRRYRLPTEEEWEYACRAETTTAYHFGHTLSHEQANFNPNHPYLREPKLPDLGRTTTVGSYPANSWGLHDMHGNVAEWCASRFGFMRVYRGGGYRIFAADCRSAFRNFVGPQLFFDFVGFRVVCEPSAQPATGDSTHPDAGARDRKASPPPPGIGMF
jgi:WD40 repeat protein